MSNEGRKGDRPIHSFVPISEEPKAQRARELAAAKRENEQLRAENKALRSVVQTSVRVLAPYANSGNGKREDHR